LAPLVWLLLLGAMLLSTEAANAELACAYGRPWRGSRHAVVPRRNRGGSLRDPEIGHGQGFVKAEIVPANGFDGRDAVQSGTSFAAITGEDE
jgi:hypothetical protein